MVKRLKTDGYVTCIIKKMAKCSWQYSLQNNYYWIWRVTERIENHTHSFQHSEEYLTRRTHMIKFKLPREPEPLLNHDSSFLVQLMKRCFDKDKQHKSLCLTKLCLYSFLAFTWIALLGHSKWQEITTIEFHSRILYDQPQNKKKKLQLD